MKVEILREAEAELNEAIEYYEEIELGLGLRLKEEARKAILRIRDNPAAPRLRPSGYRRVNLTAFPYYIASFIWSDTIWILAIAHAHRRPEYWLQRKRTSPDFRPQRGRPQPHSEFRVPSFSFQPFFSLNFTSLKW